MFGALKSHDPGKQNIQYVVTACTSSRRKLSLIKIVWGARQKNLQSDVDYHEKGDLLCLLAVLK